MFIGVYVRSSAAKNALLFLRCWDDGGAIMAEPDSASYWVVVDGRNFKTRRPIASQRFGPCASEGEAERTLSEFLPWETSEHGYSVYVEAVPAAEAGRAAKEVGK